MVNSKIKLLISSAFVVLGLNMQINAMDSDTVDKNTHHAVTPISQEEADTTYILRLERKNAQAYAQTELKFYLDEYMETPGSTFEQGVNWLTRFKINERQEKLFGGYQLSPQVAEIWNAEIAKAARSLHSVPASQ